MPTVHLRVDDGVAVITLDDPERRNALSQTLVDELVATLDALEATDEAGAVVITGAPPAFCAGADLSELGASREDGLRRIYKGFLRVAQLTLPTIAAVNGPAVGAGMNLALACDLRLAGQSARFDTRFL
ncbi:MAG: enoyl-CoA hydratase-related protein, partial [Acidimicrobiales bacterium]